MEWETLEMNIKPDQIIFLSNCMPYIPVRLEIGEAWYRKQKTAVVLTKQQRYALQNPQIFFKPLNYRSNFMPCASGNSVL